MALAPDGIQQIRRLSEVRPFLTLLHVLEPWAVIACLIYLSRAVVPLSSGIPGALVFASAILLIASRQHALEVLTHDGIHYRFARSRRLNDLACRLATSFPTFISLSKWRFIHLYHHQYTYRAGDPDTAIFGRYPITKKKFRKLVIRDLFGLNVLTNLKYFIDLPFSGKRFNRKFLGPQRSEDYRKTSDMREFYFFWAILISCGSFWGGAAFWEVLILYWLLPFCTVHQVLLRVRGAIEHGNVPNREDEYLQTRTYLLPPFLAYLIAPKNVNYHLEHSLPFRSVSPAALAPSVPEALGLRRPFRVRREFFRQSS
jgi:fatty acid desaturase